MAIDINFQVNTIFFLKVIFVPLLQYFIMNKNYFKKYDTSKNDLFVCSLTILNDIIV